MTKIERVRAALAREPVDRLPYGFWTHLPGIDLDPPRIAAETAAFQARYDLDFVKSMPNGFYAVEDWGAECDFSEIARGGVARITRPGVAAIEDWSRLDRVDVTRGAFGRELDHLARLVALVGPDVPVLATVFSPMTTAAKLSGERHRAHLAERPEQVRAGLAVITEATCAFARAAIERGCAGMFFALQDAVRAAFTAEAYAESALPFDHAVLRAAKAAGAWFDVLHAHGEDLHFDTLRDYQVDALNWHIGETAPTLAAYRGSGGARPIVGGLQRAHLTARDLPGIESDLRRTLAENGPRGLIVAPACVIRHPVDETTLLRTAALIREAKVG